MTTLARTQQGTIEISESALAQLVLRAAGQVDGARVRRPRRIKMGSPFPAINAPAGTVVVQRFPVHNWLLAEFEFLRPQRLDYAQMYVRAHLFFHATPRDLLMIFQQPGR